MRWTVVDRRFSAASMYRRISMSVQSVTAGKGSGCAGGLGERGPALLKLGVGHPLCRDDRLTVGNLGRERGDDLGT